MRPRRPDRDAGEIGPPPSSTADDAAPHLGQVAQREHDDQPADQGGHEHRQPQWVVSGPRGDRYQEGVVDRHADADVEADPGDRSIGDARERGADAGPPVRSRRLLGERCPPQGSETGARVVVGELVASARPPQYLAVCRILEQAQETNPAAPLRSEHELGQLQQWIPAGHQRREGAHSERERRHGRRAVRRSVHGNQRERDQQGAKRNPRRTRDRARHPVGPVAAEGSGADVARHWYRPASDQESGGRQQQRESYHREPGQLPPPEPARHDHPRLSWAENRRRALVAGRDEDGL